MQRVTSQFGERFAQLFQELGGQFGEDFDSAYIAFQGIVCAMFQEGISWSKIVALMCLNGALISKFAGHDKPLLGECNQTSIE